MNASTPRLASDGHDALNASFSTSYAGVLAFIAVASEGSFARAADRLGIGRSAVSRSVQKLESQLGVRLFLRTTRSTTLTREGELFLEGCNPGVTCILQALEEMRDLRGGPAARAPAHQCQPRLRPSGDCALAGSLPCRVPAGIRGAAAGRAGPRPGR